MRLLLLLAFALGSLAQAPAQQRAEHRLVRAQLLDEATGLPIPLAHVLMSSSRRGTTSDMLGYFTAVGEVGDTLRITALGYHELRIPMAELPHDSLAPLIALTPRVFELEGVTIARFGSYQRFLREAAAIALPKTEGELAQERMQAYLDKTIEGLELANLPGAGGGVLFGTDWYARQRALIERRRLVEQRHAVMQSKFSADIVRSLTPLQGESLLRFMEFCGFTEAYLLTASVYEVRERILERYQAFCAAYGCP